MARQLASEFGDGVPVFEAHLMMVDDRAVVAEVERTIEATGRCAEWVYYQVMSRYIASLQRLDDPYFRERMVDFQDVSRRVIDHLTGGTAAALVPGDVPHVIAAHDLTPSDTVSMHRTLVLGFATEAGSQTSHTAILARSLGLPAVVGVPRLCAELADGDEVIVDGSDGLVVVSPTAETVAEYEAKAAARRSLLAELDELRDTQCRTRDGREIILSANIEIEDELPLLDKVGADGIGLYRTEYLYLGGDDIPGEEEQTEVYTRVARAAGSGGVIIRTFDLGGDKLYRNAAPPEPNPFLGWRGIRVSLSDPPGFKAQLRAVLRASAHGRVGVMFPMVSGLAELLRANALLAECVRELAEAGIDHDPELEVGAMIEVPGAALIADVLAPHVDFFSIGTNDLIQYSLAVDRGNERVADLYQPCHPGIVRLMRGVVRAAEDHGIWTGVCGEMAGEVLYAPLLVGMGIDELSVAASRLPQVKRAIQRLDSTECAALVDAVVMLDGPEEVAARCRALAEANFRELLA
jgi:phosphotransferase system enzyme I (PtsI)